MQWLLRFFGWIWGCFWGWFSPPLRRDNFGATVQLDGAANPARALAAGKLVLIGPAVKPKWLRFKCPCGCGDVIALNLMSSFKPHWKIELHHDGTLTVYPSVDSQNCGSHFWIRQSKIDWV